MWLSKMKCMLVMYMEEKKEGEMEEELRVHKSISLSFSFIKKLVLVYFIMRQLSPQAYSGSKIWETVHNAGKLWQNFPRKCAENYSP